jgi:hypothetical protein
MHVEMAFQLNLYQHVIDTREMKRKDIYWVMQHWIMAVKDHATGLIFCVALPNKKASHIAHKLEKCSALAGYPCVFYTENGKDFTGAIFADLLKVNNPHCSIVMGRPHTPHGQGSIESGHKLVQ